MTFTAHLGELRTRMLRSVAVVLIMFVVSYAFSNQLITIVSWPLLPLESTAKSGVMTPVEALPEGGQAASVVETYDAGVEWVVLNPIEPVLVKLKLSAYAAILFSLPYLLWQAGAFIFPGLTVTEKRVVKILLFGCSGLALLGVGIAYWLVLPIVLKYVAQLAPDFVNMSLRLNETLSLILKLIMGFAIAFQFPMIVMVLVYMDLLTPETLRQYRKVSIVGMFVLGAILTPPDPISLLFMAMPLVALYEASIWLSYLVVRRREAAEQGA